jgi:hypothetical protein
MAHPHTSSIIGRIAASMSILTVGNLAGSMGIDCLLGHRSNLLILPQQCIRIVGKVIGMAKWFERQKRLVRLPARHVGPRRPLMGVTDSRLTWIRPEGVVAVADARVDPSEASCCGSHAYE